MKGPIAAGGTRQSFLDGVQEVELRFTSPINFRNKTGRKALSIPFLLFINTLCHQNWLSESRVEDGKRFYLLIGSS